MSYRIYSRLIPLQEGGVQFPMTDAYSQKRLLLTTNLAIGIQCKNLLNSMKQVQEPPCHVLGHLIVSGGTRPIQLVLFHYD